MNRKRWILLVDDDRSVREMVARVLCEEGYGVLAAADGEEALTFIRCVHVDLALLDLNLPGLGGWDTFEKISIEEPLLPVIIITARSNERFTAVGAGAGALLEKPLNFPILLETVKKLMDEPNQVRINRLRGHVEAFYYAPSPSKETHAGITGGDTRSGTIEH